jgi:hypothetical protein
LTPLVIDPAPFDQLEKCRKPDYRHLGGRSRRCDEMSFLLYRSGSVGALGSNPQRDPARRAQSSAFATSCRPQDPALLVDAAAQVTRRYPRRLSKEPSQRPGAVVGVCPETQGSHGVVLTRTCGSAEPLGLGVTPTNRLKWPVKWPWSRKPARAAAPGLSGGRGGRPEGVFSRSLPFRGAARRRLVPVVAGGSRGVLPTRRRSARAVE